MVNGDFHPPFGSLDFGLKRLDAQRQLLDRKWIEILLAEHRERIARLLRENFVHVHMLKVDRIAPHVNKPAVSCLSEAETHGEFT
jgi:hypothetical protein